ncbi:MAG: hypothetical protein ACREDR_36615, partial [Blastocatellia bacterium]
MRRPTAGITPKANQKIGLARLERMLQVTYGALAFAEAHGYKTYDVSDAKGIPIVLWTFTQRSFASRALRLALYGGMFLAPIGFRKLFGVRPTRYPHASAMLACAYVELSKMTGETLWFLQARSLLDWLAENTAQSPIGESWGFPFPWFSYGGVIPTTAGNAHGTIWAANAFLLYYRATGAAWALEHANRACDFLARGLNYTEHASGSLSSSYTALDRSQCFNANAESASVLLRLGGQISNTKYCEIGQRMMAFVIENQNQDGSWNYDAPLPGHAWSPNIDGFHTGMVLSALVQCVALRASVGDLAGRCVAALNKGLDFYLKNLFTADGKPLYAVRKLYPMDPYSFAQAMITLVDVCECDSVDSALRRQADNAMHAVADRTIDLMMDPEGSFVTSRYPIGAIRLKSLRWAQAVLSLAFARYS